MAMMQNVSSWFGNVSKQVTNLVSIQSPEVDDAIRAQQQQEEEARDKTDKVEDVPKQDSTHSPTTEEPKREKQEKNEESVKEETPATEKSAHELAGIDLDDVSRKAVDAAKLFGSLYIYFFIYSIYLSFPS